MKIALTIPYLPPYIFDKQAGKIIYGKVTVGGAETWGWYIAQALSKAGINVSVFTSNLPKMKKGWRTINGIRIFRADVQRLEDIVPVMNHEYIDELMKEKYDVYHFSLFSHQNFLETLNLAKKEQKAVIFSHHGCGIISPHEEERRKMLCGLAEVDLITVPSESSFEHYCNRFIQRKIAILPNGVDTQKFHSNAWSSHSKSREEFRRDHFGINNRPIVLFVGRLLPHKGVLFLIEAMKLLKKKLSKSNFPRLIICGTGDQESELKAFCRKFRLVIEEDVIFKGFVPDDLLPAYYSASDIFTLPSTRKGYHNEKFVEPEAFGMVLAEAMACEIPCVASNIPGINSVIKSEENGILVEEGSSKYLAETLSDLIENQELRIRYGKRGLYTVKRQFDWNIIAKKLILYYKQIKAKKSKPLVNYANSSKKGSIAFFAPSTTQFYSGQGQQLFEVAKRLIDNFDIEIVTDNYMDKNLDQVHEFVACHPVKMTTLKGGPSKEHLDPTVHHLDPHIRNMSENTILCMVGWANTFMGETVLRCRGKRPLAFIPHWQPTWTVSMPDNIKERLEAVLDGMLKQSDLIIAVSKEEEKTLCSRTNGKVVTALHGVDQQLFHPIPIKKEPTILFVGDLREPRKRVDLAFRVFTELKKFHPDLILQIVGKYDNKEEVWDKVPKEIKKSVEILGYIPELRLAETYARSLLFLNTASYEAFCIPLIEAMASGTIPIATRTGGVPSVIEHGVTGFLLNPNNPENDLKPVWELLNNPGKYKKIVWSGRKRVAEIFNWDTCANTIRSSLFELLARKGRSDQKDIFRSKSFSKGKRNLLIINDHFTPDLVGGAEVYLKLLTENLPSKWNVTVLRYGLQEKDSIHQGIRIFQRPYHIPDNLNFDFHEYDAVHVNAVHRLHPFYFNLLPKDRTILDIHDYWPVCPNNELVYSPGLPDLVRCQIVYDSHNPQICIECHGEKTIMKMGIRDQLIKQARVLVCHSKYMAARLKQRFEDKNIQVIHYGIDPKEFNKVPPRPVSSKPFRILFIGRISFTKGVTLFKELIQLLRESISDFELVIAGNFLGWSDWYFPFKEEIRRERLDKHIRFVGQVSNEEVPDLMSFVDICIIPSLWDEPFGIIAIESMAAGRPVIASPFGGLGEIFEHGTHSLYLKEVNAKSLAKEILFLYQNPNITKKYKKEGEKLVNKNYTLPTMTENILKIYQSL